MDCSVKSRRSHHHQGQQSPHSSDHKFSNTVVPCRNYAMVKISWKTLAYTRLYLHFILILAVGFPGFRVVMCFVDLRGILNMCRVFQMKLTLEVAGSVVGETMPFDDLKSAYQKQFGKCVIGIIRNSYMV